MEPYKNFKLAGYVYAYYLEGKTPAQIKRTSTSISGTCP